MTRFSLCTVGFRGVVTVEALIAAGVIPTRLVSYPQRGDPSGAFEQIEAIADRHGIPFERTTAPAFADGEWAMLVGWQYRVASVTDHLIVFHDSLLPRYRGFAPTATALINGDREIGVTAIRPVEAVDAGPILGQRRWMVEYPIRARAALERQAKATADLAGDLLRRIGDGTLTSTQQDTAAATYSLWRDEQDYFIDWTQSAQTIGRTVDALSYPFEGARTRVDGQEVIVDEARIVDDLVFERRDIGKVWSLDPDGPVVVCGKGCLRLTSTRSPNGKPFVFERLRARLT